MAKNVIVQLGKNVEAASILAMNRAASSAVTSASALIRQWYNLKKKDLDYRMRIVSKANKTRTYVTVAIMKGSIPLIKFNAKQLGKPGRSRRNRGPRLSQGVKATVIKGKRQLFRSAAGGSFIAKMKSGHEGVFVRTTSNQLPIAELFGVDIARLIDPKSGKSKVVEHIQQVFQKVYEQRLQHELNRRLK